MGVVLLDVFPGAGVSAYAGYRVGLSALIAAVLEIALMIWLGYEVGRAFGWNTMDSVFLGPCSPFLDDHHRGRRWRNWANRGKPFAEIIFAFSSSRTSWPSFSWRCFRALPDGDAECRAGRHRDRQARPSFSRCPRGRISSDVPRLFDYIAKFKSDELLLVAALGLCFGVALFALPSGAIRWRWGRFSSAP